MKRLLMMLVTMMLVSNTGNDFSIPMEMIELL